MGLGTVIGKTFKVCISGIFGTGMETFSKSFRRYAFKNAGAKSIFSSGGLNQGFFRNAGKAFEDVAAHETKMAAKNGGVLRNLWKQICDIPHCFKSYTKAGVRLAKMKNTSKLLGGLKGFGKAFMKKMPLIGGIIWAASYGGDVVAAFKNGGIGAGLKELGKSAGKLVLDVGGFMLGTACGGLVGGIVGSIAFGAIGNAIFGKGYKEKMAEAEEQQQQQAAQYMPQDGQYYTNPTGGVTNPQQQYQTYDVIKWAPPQIPGLLSDQQCMQMKYQTFNPWSMGQYGGAMA
ncbi:hypothetical protein J6S88_05130 [bacterium]|nr:hypothetical protein [bacterium]